MAQKPTPSLRQPRSRNRAVKAKTVETITHPEEMHASGEIQFGSVTLKGTARVTPAGLICAGIAGVTVMLAMTALARALRR